MVIIRTTAAILAALLLAAGVFAAPTLLDSPVASLARLFLNVSVANRLKDKGRCGSRLASLMTTEMGSQAFLTFFLNSGKRINDLGNYLSCKNDNASNYILTGMSMNALFLRLGICYPKECTVEELSKYKPELASYFASLVGFPVSPAMVKFVDVKQNNKELGKHGTGYAAFWVITGVLILLAVVGTVMDESGFFAGSEQGAGLRALQCFSLSRNLTSFFRTKNPVDPNLEIFNGVRFFAMCWIVIGHCQQTEMLAPTFNIWNYYMDIMHNYWFSYVKSATLSVDVFFFISGFFAALSFFGAFRDAKNRSIKTVLFSYLYRYLRLLPLLLFTLLFLMFVLTTIKDQPSHPNIQSQIDNCEKRWLWSFLYVGNFQDFNDACIDWSWYLMNDMQFFVVAPIFVIAFLYSHVTGLVVLAVAAVGSTVVTAFIYVYNDLHTSMAKTQTNSYYTIYYSKPYCRILPYLLGIFLYVVYKESKKNEDERLTYVTKIMNTFSGWGNYVFYAVAIVMMHMCVTTIYYFDNNTESWGTGLATLYELSFRPLFVLGLIFLILPTLIGKGDFLLAVLGHSMFNPLAKITYGAYMLHLLLINLIAVYTLSGHYTNQTWIWVQVFTVVFVGYAASFVVSMIYEAPTAHLLKEFLERSRGKAPAKLTEGGEPLVPKLTEKTE